MSIKLAQPFRPQNCGHEFYGHGDFLTIAESEWKKRADTDGLRSREVFSHVSSTPRPALASSHSSSPSHPIFFPVRCRPFLIPSSLSSPSPPLPPCLGTSKLRWLWSSRRSACALVAAVWQKCRSLPTLWEQNWAAKTAIWGKSFRFGLRDFKSLAILRFVIWSTQGRRVRFRASLRWRT